MSRPQEALLKNLCHRLETQTRAKVILHTAIAKTGQGSGYELGDGSSGLPAICAYIAAHELGNGDVSEKIAQSASCLAPKVFKSTLNVVRAALAASAPQERAPTRRVTYEALIKQHKFAKRVDFMLSCMRSVEQALVASTELHDDLRPPCDAVTVTVFCWTCTDLLGIKKVQPVALLRDYAVVQCDYDEVLDILVSSCRDVAERIKRDTAALSKRAKATPSTPSKAAARTPSARSPTKSPSKSALKSASAVPSPTKTPTHKRKVAFSDGPDDSGTDTDRVADATPSKRPKLASPTKPARALTRPGAAHANYRSPAKPRVFPGTEASSSRATLDMLRPAAADEEDAIEALFPAIQSTPVAGPSTPRRRSASSEAGTPRSASRMTGRGVPPGEEPRRARRFRPVFLEHDQWLQRDPKIEREWKAAEALVRSVVERYGDASVSDAAEG